MLFLLKFFDIMSKTTILTEFTLSKVYHILTHFCFFLFFYVVVEFLPLLIIGKHFFSLLTSCLTIFISGGRGFITGAMVGRGGVVGAVLIVFFWDERFESAKFLILGEKSKIVFIIIAKFNATESLFLFGELR